MLSQLETQCFSILTAASSATYGLVLRTSNPQKARATLYRLRKEIGNVVFDGLQIRVSPDDSEHELWLIRRQEAPGFDISQIL